MSISNLQTSKLFYLYREKRAQERRQREELHLLPVLLVAHPRPNTENEHRTRLRDYRSLQEFDAAARSSL
jgi:hypothetical protein